MKVENQTAIELSNEELDVVAGGTDVFTDVTQYQSEILVVGQKAESAAGGSSAAANIARQKINAKAAHLIGLAS
ncbi:MAG: CTB family bacteriocin [Goleter apudmare HA4340-LM2]|jgi:hypothetical protein|nr:CTB family bacteriocin [Goleter apudmare HA4340-LM2]